MKHAQCLRDLLRPLGVYDLEAPFNGGELDAQGEALDKVMAWVEEVQREASLASAESWGVERMAELFARRPLSPGSWPPPWPPCCVSAGTALPWRPSTTPSPAAVFPPW